MPTSSKKKTKAEATSWWGRVSANQIRRYEAFMARRPHRSFRMTRRRDYVRPLELPGYISFTHEVTRTVWRYCKTFALLAVVYSLLYAVLVGIQSQDSYTTLVDTLKQTSGDIFSGNWGAIGQAGLLFVSISSLGVSESSTEAQQIFSVLVFLMAWLTTVWLLRNLLAGYKVRLRDGLYNSGSPLFAMAVLALVIAAQLIPAALAFLGYTAAAGSGLLEGGAASMLFWIGAGLLCVLSLYWITSSLFAMIIITVPGTYPYQAIKAAGDLMIGRRIKILLRWLWMALMVVLAWLLVLIPIILLDMGIKAILPFLQAVPIVPISVIFMAAFTTIWASAYVYLLYRKVIDYDPAK